MSEASISPSRSSARARRATAPSCGAGRPPSSSTRGSPLRETKRRLAVAGRRARGRRGGVPDARALRPRLRGARALEEGGACPSTRRSGRRTPRAFPGPLFADVRIVRGGRDLVVGDLHVRVTSTPHDGVESVCYVFADGGGTARRDGRRTSGTSRGASSTRSRAARCSASRRTTTRISCARAPTRPSSSGASCRTSGHLSNEAAAGGLEGARRAAHALRDGPPRLAAQQHLSSRRARLPGGARRDRRRASRSRSRGTTSRRNGTRSRRRRHDGSREGDAQERRSRSAGQGDRRRPPPPLVHVGRRRAGPASSSASRSTRPTRGTRSRSEPRWRQSSSRIPSSRTSRSRSRRPRPPGRPR